MVTDSQKINTNFSCWVKRLNFIGEYSLYCQPFIYVTKPCYGLITGNNLQLNQPFTFRMVLHLIDMLKDKITFEIYFIPGIL